MSLKVAPMSQRCCSCSVAFLQGVLGIRWGRQVTLFSFGLSCTRCGHLIPPSLQRHWIVRLMPTTLEMGGTFQPSLDEASEQAQPGGAGRFWRGGGVRLHHPCGRQQLSGLGTRWVLWSQARGVKKGHWHCKAEVPCSVPCLEWYMPKGQEGLPCRPKGCVWGWGSVLQSFRVIHWGRLTQPGSPCAGLGHSQPRCLHRGSAVPSGQGAEAGPGLGPRFPFGELEVLEKSERTPCY